MKYLKKYLYVLFVCTCVPVLIYGPTANNKFGHVCILVALLDSDTFIVFEQDGFKQDGAKLTTRGKDNLIGCLYKE